MTQTFTVEGELPGLNEIIASAKQGGRGHGAVYAALKRQHTQKVAWLAKAAGLRTVTRSAVVRFIWFAPNRRRDKDNISAGGRKMILDGLEQAGVIPRDNWQWIAGFEDHFEIDRKNPRTEVVIEEVE